MTTNKEEIWIENTFNALEEENKCRKNILLEEQRDLNRGCLRAVQLAFIVACIFIVLLIGGGLSLLL